MCIEAVIRSVLVTCILSANLIFASVSSAVDQTTTTTKDHAQTVSIEDGPGLSNIH